VRAAGAQAAGVTTVADIEPDLQRRLALISRWTQPAYASVNLCEDGAVEVMRTLLAAGNGYYSHDSHSGPFRVCHFRSMMGRLEVTSEPKGAAAPGLRSAGSLRPERRGKTAR
jgi:hypothetical protein